MPQSPHFGAVPAFLMCKRRRDPPGVLIVLTLFEEVLYLQMAISTLVHCLEVAFVVELIVARQRSGCHPTTSIQGVSMNLRVATSVDNSVGRHFADCCVVYD